MSDPQTEHQVRYRFIRILYLLTACIGTSTGLLILVAPSAARIVLGIPSRLPEQEPIVFGLLGAFWLGVALISLLGLRAPLKYLPIFLVQLVYKSLWFLFVFAPLAIRHEFPSYGITIAVGNALWMAMDLRAIPFRYLLSKDDVELPAAEPRSEKSAQTTTPGGWDDAVGAP